MGHHGSSGQLNFVADHHGICCSSLLGSVDADKAGIKSISSQLIRFASHPAAVGGYLFRLNGQTVRILPDWSAPGGPHLRSPARTQNVPAVPCILTPACLCPPVVALI